MKNLLLYMYQFPQNLVGLLVILFSRAKKTSFNGIVFYETESKFGVSLGNYIILHNTCTWNDVYHEYGHQKQSLKLGWLYLLIIGLPSFTFNIGDRIFHKKWQTRDRLKWYYKLPWEYSADKLGGVDRSWLYKKNNLRDKKVLNTLGIAVLLVGFHAWQFDKSGHDIRALINLIMSA